MDAVAALIADASAPLAVVSASEAAALAFVADAEVEVAAVSAAVAAAFALC